MNNYVQSYPLGGGRAIANTEREHRRETFVTGAKVDVDVMLAAPVFFDLVLSDLDVTPRPGTEVRAGALSASPGGSATVAVATSRLGLRTLLAAPLGDDVYGRWCWEFLANEENIDLHSSVLVPGWATPVTVSIATDGDRTMVTRHDPSPVPADDLLDDQVAARAALIELGGMSDGEAWWQRAAAAGTQLFADTGWDSTGRWDPADLDPLASCFAFTPNATEAMAYTRTDSPSAAARVLADRVPLAVVTCGVDGAIGVDAANGREVAVPAVPVDIGDATGAGDVFRAALLLGTLREWPLEQRLAFAALCAALAVERPGGAVAAPGWGDIADWWTRTDDTAAREVRARYEFLTDVLPCEPRRRRSPRAAAFSDYPARTAAGSIPAPQKGTS